MDRVNTNELEELLEGGRERSGLDFKASCAWAKAQEFAKDILAMSNTRDGGYIVVGVNEQDDGSYTRMGVSATDRVTYKEDEMRDQMTKYADPHVDFSCQVLSDAQGLFYVVIRVYEFTNVPVICRKDSNSTQAGTIYFRNSNRRIESAPLSNSSDMRELIERAAIKQRTRWHALGLESKQVSQFLDDELGELK